MLGPGGRTFVTPLRYTNCSSTLLATGPFATHPLAIYCHPPYQLIVTHRKGVQMVKQTFLSRQKLCKINHIFNKQKSTASGKNQSKQSTTMFVL